jgi:hypothetical protein
VLAKGEPVLAPAGRADDFAWPRREIAPVGGDPTVVTATLPLTPMKSEQKAAAPTPEGPQAPPAPGAPGQARPGTPPQTAQRPSGPRQQTGWFGNWGGWQGSRQSSQQRSQPGFFPFLFRR